MFLFKSILFLFLYLFFMGVVTFRSHYFITYLGDFRYLIIGLN